MRITRIDCRIHRSGFTYGAGAGATGGNLALRSIETLLVRVETEDGLHGWGEGFGFTLAETTRSAVERLLAPACIGEDSRDIAGIGRRLRRKFHNFGRNGPVTFGVSAIDIALWDIAGRRAGRPLHALLGDGGRTAVPAYASLLRYGAADAVARNVAEALRRGYQAIKLHEVDQGCIRAARAAMPEAMPLMLDINCAFDAVPDALAFCRAVAPFRPHWIEEPLWPPEAHGAMTALRREAGCAIAAGENCGGVEDAQSLVATGGVDVIQPSATKHGGVTALLAVAEHARRAGLRCAPHTPYLGPGLLATLHVLAAQPEAERIEIYFVDADEPPHGGALIPVDGILAVPDGPGLGLEPVG